MEADLVVTLRNQRTLRAIDSALAPDNIDLPSGMNLSQKLKGRQLKIWIGIALPRVPVETLISTMDEIIAHIHSIVSSLARAEDST